LSADAWITAAGTACAAFAAIVAVFQTKKSLERQQVQNHKAVLPIPQVIFGDYVDHLFVKLENAGTGPMKLSEVLVKDAACRVIKRSIIDVLKLELPTVLWTTFVGNIDNRVIGSGDSLTLIDYEGDEHAKIRSILSRLAISIAYTDVYGNRFDLYKRSFDWFARDSENKNANPVGYA
jgi:hypothetical protein